MPHLMTFYLMRRSNIIYNWEYTNLMAASTCLRSQTISSPPNINYQQFRVQKYSRQLMHRNVFANIFDLHI